MQASKARATVGQDHLDRSAAIIQSLKKRRRAGEKLDEVQRYAFVEVGGQLFAVPARRGSKIGVVVGGVSYPVRAPKTAAEKAAVLRAEAVLPGATRLPPSTVALMAQKIVAAAGRGVERRDFRQAGISEADIDAHFDQAMALARRLDPQIDAMLSMPVAA